MSKPVAIPKGIAFAFPDVCLTPSPVGPIPIPYPNIAQLSQASPVSDTSGKELLVGSSGDHVLLKDSEISSSSGDEGGTAGGGVTSGSIEGTCKLVLGSGSVFYGPNKAGLVRSLDQTDQNIAGGVANAHGIVLSAFPTVLVGD
jgi:hypothetical protein